MERPSERNLAIDMLRAITMALMLFVNNLWTVSGIPHSLEHAAPGEDMLGLADIVFPSFLFCVGLSIPYSIGKMVKDGKRERDIMAHILTRGFALLLMGCLIVVGEYGINADASHGIDGNIYSLAMALAIFLIYNRYSRTVQICSVLKTIGWVIVLGLMIIIRTGENCEMFSPHWWGILGLIGWAYLVCATMYFFLHERRHCIIIPWCLFLALNLALTPTRHGGNLLGTEGHNMLSAIASVLHVDNAANALLVMSGVIFSVYVIPAIKEMSKWRMSAVLIALSFIAWSVAELSHGIFITSKLTATLPWISYTICIDILAYMFLEILVRSAFTGWFGLISTAGTATLTCYMIPYIIEPLQDMAVGMDWSHSLDGDLGVFKCACYSLLCIWIAAGLTKLGIKLRI